MDTGRLTSNHVNYLIWRYLQESGHGEAAVKLQRDWIQDPQSLPYAQDTKTHALVRLVQKGIQYYQIEQSINQNGSHFLPASFLDPQTERAQSSPKADGSHDESTGKPPGSPRSRKHGRELSTTNGLNLELPTSTPAAKRTRRINGTTTNANNQPAMVNGEPRDGDSMDLDDHQNGFVQHEPPEPKSPKGSPEFQGQTAAEGANMDVDDDAPEPDDPRMILTNGPSVGVQSDKVTELGPETSVLMVPQRNVLHTAWSPTDPLLLAAAGDALCRIWTVTKSSDAPLDHPNRSHQYVDILEPGDDSSVTALSWSPDGTILAIATRPDDTEQAGEVSLWSKQGKSMDNLLTTQDMLIAFKWNPSGTRLLGITCSGNGSSALTVWDIFHSHTLPTVHLDNIATDATWYDDHRFLVSGHSLVAECIIEPHNVLSSHSRAVPEEHSKRNWTYTRYDPSTQSAAIAAEDSAVLAILGSNGQFLATTAHCAELTDIALEPLGDPSSNFPTSPRRLATSSLDGSICVWDMTTLTILHSLNFCHSNPPMAICFTADGHLLAAANGNRVLYWNAETGGMPKAVWHGDPAPLSSGAGFGSRGEDRNGGGFMDGDSGIGEEDEGSTHSLSWDPNGGRLAYGMGSQVCSYSNDPKSRNMLIRCIKISIIGLRPQSKRERSSNPTTPAPS
ncbi:MAG: hypothetical protein Q9186_002908 [Xanthomendoza sp. 1 TL-2023]